MPRRPQVEYDHATYYHRLSNAIVYFRRDRGLSQEELAEMVGISRRYLSKIESISEPTPFSLELLFNFAVVLGVDPSQLLSVPYPDNK